jgi:hypothetical protein
VERLHGLLDGRLVVPPVDLVQVDVVGAQSPQRGVDGVEDMAPGESAVVRPLTHREADLGGQHVVLSPAEHLPQQTPGDLFAHPHRVHVGGVEERDARFGGTPDERSGGFLVQRPVPPGGVAVGHHP